MGEVQDHQAVGHLRQVQGEEPGDGPAPVVAHDDRALPAVMADHRGDVADEEGHGVLLHSLGLVTSVVPPEIEGD